MDALFSTPRALDPCLSNNGDRHVEQCQPSSREVITLDVAHGLVKSGSDLMEAHS